ncbi:uncharacterized protein LTR77_008985 [Saxophila tyrrhenica]|uniref:BTB domain-containing protein n=1 Tax=Saxophila tyrrhenica TaxID=1690608 RepID=A0AAV9P2L4_9PEZI|nr:hypothetical protein LTR77_008985 [Saxophila tyrrhenica]
MTTNALSVAIVKHFNRAEFSDLAIRCGSRKWFVHKVAVCAQCEILAQAVSAGLEPTRAGVLSLPDNDPEGVGLMLEWLYTSDYGVMQPPTTASSHAEVHARVWYLAEKYQLSKLMEHALPRYWKSAGDEWFNRPEFSDVTIRCGGREWPAHRIVLCNRSEYFKRALQSGFKEGLESVIELHEDDPNAVELMLEWL